MRLLAIATALALGAVAGELWVRMLAEVADGSGPSVTSAPVGAWPSRTPSPSLRGLPGSSSRTSESAIGSGQSGDAMPLQAVSSTGLDPWPAPGAGATELLGSGDSTVLRDAECVLAESQDELIPPEVGPALQKVLAKFREAEVMELREELARRSALGPPPWAASRFQAFAAFVGGEVQGEFGRDFAIFQSPADSLSWHARRRGSDRGHPAGSEVIKVLQGWEVERRRLLAAIVDRIQAASGSRAPDLTEGAVLFRDRQLYVVTPSDSVDVARALSEMRELDDSVFAEAARIARWGG